MSGGARGPATRRKSALWVYNVAPGLLVLLLGGAVCEEKLPAGPPATDDDVCTAGPMPTVIRGPDQTVQTLAISGDTLYFVLWTLGGAGAGESQSVRSVRLDGSGERTLHSFAGGLRIRAPLFVRGDKVYFLGADPAGPGRWLMQAVPSTGGAVESVGVFVHDTTAPALFASDEDWLYVSASQRAGSPVNGGVYRMSRRTGATTSIAQVASAVNDAQLADGTIWYRTIEPERVFRVAADVTNTAPGAVKVPITCRHRVVAGGLFCGSTGTLTRFDPATLQERILIDVRPIHGAKVAPVFEPLDDDGTWLYVVERRSGQAARDLRRVNLQSLTVEFVACGRSSMEHLRATPGGALWTEMVISPTGSADRLLRLDL